MKDYLNKIHCCDCLEFMKGLPDITILNPDGRYLCIELKTSKGKQSQGQINFERKVPNHYRIIRSFEDFEKQVEELVEDKTQFTDVLNLMDKVSLDMLSKKNNEFNNNKSIGEF